MTAKTEKQQTGNISVNTENILPIIKKWLYSDHEIFLRELISNSFDAITKRNKIALKESLDISVNGKINITIDEKKKTITISDNGLGMDADEIQKYINQIAFSGAEEFVEKYKEDEKGGQIIGHFGLGFYSSFMVADTVEINSLSYKKGSKAANWFCEGSTEYKISEGNKKEVGTDIILYVNDESKDYLSEDKIKDLVEKYANFLPVEIQVNSNKANDQNPLWIKTPLDVKDEEYIEFYQKLYPLQGEPLFWIHLNVDYPFNLKGILYFPKLTHELDAHNKGQVKLFCQQVFVSDNIKEVLPEFLTLLQGAIDCPDIPLNISRSYLQNDPYVQKISKHIVKKVADKLTDLSKKDKKSFEKYWADINPFVKYGMMTNDDFYGKVKDIVLFTSSNGNETTIQEYLDRNKGKNENKVFYCADKETQASYVELFKAQELEVVYLSNLIDTHFLQFIESKNTDIKYVSVDSDISEHLIDKDKESKIVDPKDNKTSDQKIEDIFKEAINNEKLKIKVQALKSENTPALILESEQSKRMKAMSNMMKGMDTAMFEDNTLVLNSSSPVVKKVLDTKEKLGMTPKVSNLCEYIYDLALMSKRPLKGAEIQKFIERSNSLLRDIL
jgi:molecular chaperone HtpG